MALAVARCDVHFGPARTRHMDADVPSRAEAINPQTRSRPTSRTDSGQAQRAITNDASAEKRCGLHVVKAVRQFVSEGCRRDRVFRVAAVNSPSGEACARAQVLSTGKKEAALAAGALKPSDADTFADGKVSDVCSDCCHSYDKLVARNDWGATWGKLALNDVQVCAADRAGVNAHEHFIIARRRLWDINKI